MNVGDTYTVPFADIARDRANEGTEHKMHFAGDHLVTVQAVNARGRTSVECACGARWVYEEDEEVDA